MPVCNQDIIYCDTSESARNVPMAHSKSEQLAKLYMVLEIAKRNGNQLFITNIKRDIAALENGEESPLVKQYLTEEERK
tara:strand:+ start:291 stop:527 length:237 start_codon:yes stop_codon:yes gene_type:complete